MATLAAVVYGDAWYDCGRRRRLRQYVDYASTTCRRNHRPSQSRRRRRRAGRHREDAMKLVFKQKKTNKRENLPACQHVDRHRVRPARHELAAPPMHLLRRRLGRLEEERCQIDPVPQQPLADNVGKYIVK